MVDLENRTIDRFGESRAIPAIADKQQEMLRWAPWLQEKDRVIFQLSIKGNLTLREMADIVNLEAGSISRRLTRIRQRMTNPITLALLDGRGGLTPEARDVGLEYFLTGLGLGEIADRHRLSIEQARRMIQFVRGWHRGRVTGV